MKLYIIAILCFSFLLCKVNSVTVCGHVYGFPNNGPIKSVNLKILVYKEVNEKIPDSMYVTTSNELGAFCFENLPGNFYVQVLASKMLHKNLSTPTIKLPAEGCLLPELNIQLPKQIVLNSALLFGRMFGKLDSYNKGCLMVATVTRPCHGMYSKNSHGLEGAKHQMYRLNESTNKFEAIQMTTEYLGVTRVDHSLLPDSTCFGEIIKGTCTQLPSKDGPHSWDGGALFMNVEPGIYKLSTVCNGSNVCPNDTVFQDVIYNCQTNTENKNFVFVNASPSQGPRPISGKICADLGPTCGAQIPDPYNKNADNVWRKELREKCQLKDENLVKSMGQCDTKFDPRWDSIQQKTNKQTWLDFNKYLSKQKK